MYQEGSIWQVKLYHWATPTPLMDVGITRSDLKPCHLNWFNDHGTLSVPCLKLAESAMDIMLKHYSVSCCMVQLYMVLCLPWICQQTGYHINYMVHSLMLWKLVCFHEPVGAYGFCWVGLYGEPKLIWTRNE